MFQTICKKIKYWILFIWSFSPIFALTNDSTFGTIECKEKLSDYSENLRISLINLMLGNNIIYFVTIHFSTKKEELFSSISGKHFNFFVLLSLDAMQQFNPSASDMEKISSAYEQYICGDDRTVSKKTDKESPTDADLEIERNFIIYKIQNEDARIQKSDTKVNLYSAISLALIPILVATVDFQRLSYLSTIGKIVCFLCVYSFFNLIIHVLYSMRVRGIEKSCFKDFKTCPNHRNKEIMNYYNDWQYLKRKADLHVSYVANIQNWIAFAFIFTIAISVWISFAVPIKINTIQPVDSNTITSINLDEINTNYSISSVEWSKLDLAIQQKSISRIYFISSNKSVNSILEKRITLIPNDISIVYLYDESLDKNIFKIFVEE